MTACKEWLGAKAGRGYGQRKVDGRWVYVHRLTWEEAHGSIPVGMVVMHTCDNPPCYELEHLRLGTQADNVADMRAKGRSAEGGPGIPRNSGEAHWKSKLTASEVTEIRAALAAGELQRMIAKRYGVTREAISRIKTRTNWKTDFVPSPVDVKVGMDWSEV